MKKRYQCLFLLVLLVSLLVAACGGGISESGSPVATNSAYCVSGTTLNTANGRCEADPTCVSGTYDSINHNCSISTISYIAVTCPSGGGWSSAFNTCYCTHTWATCSSSCSAEYKYNGVACLANPSCNQGVYSGNGQCQLTTNSTAPASCPVGTSLNLLTNKCDAAPI